MSFQKGNKVEVQDFKFGQLSPSTSEPGLVSDYKLETLNPTSDFKKTISADEIRVERESEWATGFNIDENVREHRGLREQEHQDFEQRVEEEIQARLDKRVKQAYEEGFRQGQEDGAKQAYDASMEEYEQKINVFENFLINLMEEKKAIIEESKLEAYSLIRNLTKWIVLKEIQDKEYLERLLEKLILEINTKSNLLIKVNSNDIGNMPELIKNVETRLGNLSNIRVEVGNELTARGIILESEVGVVDGSFKSQMNSLDKLFENVGIQSTMNFENTDGQDNE